MHDIIQEAQKLATICIHIINNLQITKVGIQFLVTNHIFIIHNLIKIKFIKFYFTYVYFYHFTILFYFYRFTFYLYYKEKFL